MYHNNRSLRFNELMPAEGKIDMDKLKAIKFDKRYPQRLAFGVTIDSMLMISANDYPQWRPVIENLQQWDRNGDPESRGAAVFLLAYHHLQNHGMGPVTKTEALAAYEHIYNYQVQHFGHAQATLGDIQKLVRGEVEYPMYGLPDVLAAEYSVPHKNGTRKVNVGDAYIMFIRYGKQGLPVIETVNTYGASAHPGNPHFADQAPLYLQQKTKPMTLDKETVLKYARRIYHPGQ
jgi:acyl-homoserine-lactone acylase